MPFGCSPANNSPRVDDETAAQYGPRPPKESDMTTILIAEDHDDVRVVLHRLFTRAEFTVLTAPDGRVALHEAQQHRPDIVLTDLNMPHLDGLQLCQAIRKDPALADIPVAILSAGIQAGDPRAADAHVCGVLLKPFVNDELVTTIRRLADTGRHDHARAPACAASA